MIPCSFVEIWIYFEKKLSLSSEQKSESWGVRSTLFRNVGRNLYTIAVDVSHTLNVNKVEADNKG